MKIEERRDYRTRDGRKVHITKRALENGLFWGETSDGGLWRWHANGDVHGAPDGDLDIVTVWQEPDPHVRDDPEWPGYMQAGMIVAQMQKLPGNVWTTTDLLRRAAAIADDAVREGRKR